MWRVGVLALVTVLCQLTSADVKYEFDSPLLQRLKRSPQYDNCGAYYPPRPPPFWPHRHPRYWPPPPPPAAPFWPPPPPPPPPPPQPDQYQVYTVANSEAKSNAAANEGNNEKAGPACSTCGENRESNAVSNAESVSGQAVAIAVARANSH